MTIDKVFYNQASATKLDWDPSWFDAKEFDDDLTEAIKRWQQKNGLGADGMCGPTTYRRVFTERLSKIDNFIPEAVKDNDTSYIVHRGNLLPIEWPKVKLWSEAKDYNLVGGFSPYYEERNIKMFVNHWDVCLNSRSCARVLKKRGISVHFCIDNDGTIYQLLDMNHAAWHAGSKKWNHSSVGVEISNAYYPKYQGWYDKHGFGDRPIIENETVHGRSMKPFTGFYDVQIEAMKALWKAVHEGIGIPYKCPLDKNGNTLKKVSTSAAANRFNGFVSHYHLTSRKIDCAGLDINTHLNEIK